MVKYILKDKILKIISIFCGLFVILPFKLKPISVVLILVYLIIYRPRYNFNKFSFFLTFYLSIHILSLFNGFNDLGSAINLIVRTAPFIIIPLFINSLNENEFEIFKKKTLTIFLYSTLFYGFIILVYLYFLGSLNNNETLNYGYSYITNEFYGFNDHPIYITSYFSVLMLIISFKQKKTNFDYFSLAFLIFLIFLLARKGVIIALLLIFILKLISGIKLNYRILFLSIIIIISVLFLFPSISERFTELTAFKQGKDTSTGIRVNIWKYSIEAIMRDPLLGVGWVNYKEELNTIYLKNEANNLINKNCHNQFLQIVLSTGIFGFLSISITYFRAIFERFKNLDLFICTQLLFFILFCIESYLERQNGVIFF